MLFTDDFIKLLTNAFRNFFVISQVAHEVANIMT